MGWWKNRVARGRNRQRAIFRFWDGEQERGIDPAVAYRALWSHQTYDPATHPMLAEAGDVKAWQIMLDGIRDVFGIKPWVEDASGQHGLTDEETRLLIIGFNEYLEGLKKSGNPMPTSPPPTVPPPLATDSPTTNAPLDSGSTSGESKSDAPSTS